MRNVKAIWLLAILCLAGIPAAVRAQAPADVMEVDVKGTGVKRDDALHDALRAAVAQVAGVALKSETKVENFMVVQDAVSTRTEGYISSYNVTKEVPFPDRYEVSIHARVSLSPLKADMNLLSKSVGGVRFLVMYDDRQLTPEEKQNYSLAVDKINGYLSQHQYRYIEKSRFESLRKEALNIMQSSDTSRLNYVQYLGILSDAQFIIQVKHINTQSREGAFGTRTESMAGIDIAAYDNCTAEGLGTISLQSGWKDQADLQGAIAEAVNKDFDKLLYTFNSYIGNWVNNGTPYELRFYTTGTYRDFRDLRTKLKADPSFGGDMEIVSTGNYTRLNCTFSKKPDELADIVLDYADQTALKDKRLDVKLIYGRQVSFAPTGVSVPGAQQQQNTKANSPAGSTGGQAAPPAGNGSTPANGGIPAGNSSTVTNGSSVQPAAATAPARVNTAPKKTAAPVKKVQKKVIKQKP